MNNRRPFCHLSLKSYTDIPDKNRTATQSHICLKYFLPPRQYIATCKTRDSNLLLRSVKYSLIRALKVQHCFQPEIILQQLQWQKQQNEMQHLVHQNPRKRKKRFEKIIIDLLCIICGFTQLCLHQMQNHLMPLPSKHQ